MTYWLSVVKFVPDPAKGEFVNVGAIAGSDDTEEWEVRPIVNWARAKNLDERVPIGAAADFLGGLQRRIELAEDDRLPPGERFTLSKLRSLSGEMNNIVQLSDPIPVALPSAAAVLELAFRELIVDAQTRKLGYLTKHAAVRETLAAYRAVGVENFRNARVETGRDETKFDFAVADGTTVQLVKCWSFQLLEQTSLANEIKAWAWGVHDLRKRGDARALVEDPRTPRRAFPVDGKKVDIEVVFAPPTEDQRDRKAFEVAEDAFAEIEVSAHPLGDAIKVAREARARLMPLH